MSEDAVGSPRAIAADPGAVGVRRFLGLALPALGVLIAEPLYLLLDTAVVGHLGAAELAGLALGAVVLAQVSTQLTFLSYGTTARAARLYGGGRRADAVGEGVQATWVALAVGLVIVGVVQAVARPLAGLLAGSDEVADAATGWIRVAVCGAPLILVSLAGNGWMRAVQDTRTPLYCAGIGVVISAVLCPLLVHGLAGAPRLGLAGSAWANLAGQLVAGALFLRVLVRAQRSLGAPLRPSGAVMGAQLVLGRDLILRSLAFQACFLSAAAVAAHFGAAALGAHQIVLQLWNFVSLALDALAIAAQTLVGAALGARAVDAARTLARRATRWSLACACVIAAFFATGWAWIPPLFTNDDAVIAQGRDIWWIFVALLPIAGIVFALDGVLLGAGDAAFLRTATIACAVVGFLPAIWLSSVLDAGLVGIWIGLAVFMVFRMAAVVARARSGRWAVPGAQVRQPE